MPRKMCAKSRERVMELVRADPERVGPQLGLISMKYNVPPEAIGDLLGVSTGCVYRWFYGETSPRDIYSANIKKLLTILRRALLAHEFPLAGSHLERMQLMVQVVQRYKHH